MNEGIGSRGGRNDRRRSLKIKLRQKKKLKKLEKLSEKSILEKKVKRNQILNFIFIVPITLLGGIVKSVVEKEDKSHINKIKQEEKLETEKVVEIQEENPVIDNSIEKNKDVKAKAPTQIKTSKKEEIFEKEISQIKSRKIVEKYEEKVKEIRYKLRNIYYEADLINEFNELENNPSEKNLEKLTDLISRLEDLKKKLEKESKIELDQDYIEVLVEEDIEKIENNIETETINNCKLYISISNKIDELKDKKEKTEIKLQQEKAARNLNEEAINNIKDKKEISDNFNNELLNFQYEQDKIINDVENKIKVDINKKDYERIQLNGISRQTNLLLRKMRIYMRIPGIRSGRKVINLTTSYLYSVQKILVPKQKRIRYKRVKADDFDKQIEKNMQEMTNVLENIHKTKFQLEKVIKNFTSKYLEYQESDEFKKLLNELNIIKKNLEEKEYEIKRLKEEQEKKQQKVNDQNKIYRL